MSRFLPYLLPIFLLIILGIFLLINKPWQNQSEEELKTEVKLLDYESQEYGFKLKYSEDFVQGKLPQEQPKDPLMLKLVRIEPPTLVNIWKESGLGILNLYIKKSLLEYLKNNLDTKYAKEYNDFQKEKMEDSKIAGLDAFTVWFTFQNKEKDFREKIKLTVTVKDNIAYYLQCMAPKEMFTYAEPSCDLISTNFQFMEKK